MNTQNLTITAILNTHEHQDRHCALDLMRSALKTNLVAGEVDQLGWPVNCEQLQLTEQVLEKLATPGHSQDSVSYLLKANNGDVQYCFCGDLILPAGLGNTVLDGEMRCRWQTL